MKTEKQIMSEYFSSLGKKCLKTMTKKERSERAKKASEARWAKLKDYKLTHTNFNEKNNY